MAHGHEMSVEQLEKYAKEITALPGPDPMGLKEFTKAYEHEKAEHGHASGGIGSVLPGALIGGALSAGGAFALQAYGVDPSLGMFPGSPLGMIPLTVVGAVGGGVVDHQMDKAHEDKEVRQAYAKYLKSFEHELRSEHAQGHGHGHGHGGHEAPAHGLAHGAKGHSTQHIG